MDKTLVIDSGNTNTKLGVFSAGKLQKKYLINTDSCYLPDDIKGNNFPLGIISSTAKKNSCLFNLIIKEFPHFMIMDHKTLLPIGVAHNSPETLGQDRKAACVGANYIFGNNPLLVIDAGSALTFDLVLPGKGMTGGNISPGLTMRFKSLYNFSGNLPLLKADKIDNLMGKTTNESIISGVQTGAIKEVEWYTEYFSEKYTDIKIVLTGGDSGFFAEYLKNSIFVKPNLVLIGLYRILIYAAKF